MAGVLTWRNLMRFIGFGVAVAGVALLLTLPGAARLGADAIPQKTLDLLKTFDSEFIQITPGNGKFPPMFVMGTDGGTPAERPAHKVTLNSGFSIAKYEVPQNLYEAVMGQNPSRWKGPRNSAEMFSFGEAQEFCGKITALLRQARLLKDDEAIRLPTEAEWEYCCRAGTTTAYSFGESAVKPDDNGAKASLLDEYGWHTGNAAGNDPEVGEKRPNPWGLYDMHGYLWEFVSDAWHDNYTGAPTDGRNWSSDDDKPRHTIRGGSWKDRHEFLTSTYRRPLARDAKDAEFGMRCVKAKVR
jgi:formylglycine-generating enzyme required for sulfatase activity